jgi:zinc protease
MQLPNEQLRTVMEFKADRMTGLVLNVLPERNVVLEEYNMRLANNPDARLTEQIFAAFSTPDFLHSNPTAAT